VEAASVEVNSYDLCFSCSWAIRPATKAASGEARKKEAEILMAVPTSTNR